MSISGRRNRRATRQSITFALLGLIGAFVLGSGAASGASSRDVRISSVTNPAGTAQVAARTPRRSAVPRLRPVDGGPNYYRRFSNPLPVASSFFPVAVWGSYAHEKSNVAKDKAVGINTYVWVADTTARFMQNIRKGGQHVIQDVDNQANHGSETNGWLLADEIDMTVGGSACPSQNDARRRKIPGSHPALVYSNYGKGVMFWGSNASGACFVNYDDVNSADIYWFTDGNVCTSASEGPRFYGVERRALTQAECRRARNYGDAVREMRRLDALNGSPRHPIWNFVEVGCPFSNGNCITPAQARAATWHSLIAGARGILYFQHSFSGQITHHALRDTRYASVQATVRATNRQIKALAPVLNAPFVVSRWTHNRATKAMVKWQRGHFYVFAGSAENVGSTGSFSIPCVGNATARVVGENRKIPVRRGSFRDSFADGNAVHIYRIDGGSACGLNRRP